MIYAELSFKQKYHQITKEFVAPQMYFCVKMPFDEGLNWIIGRRPMIDNSPFSYAIPIQNPAITSMLAKITAILTNHGCIHILKSLSDKQFFSIRNNTISKEHILKDGDTFTISKLPLEFQYKIIEVKDNTRPEDDTLSFMPDATV